MQMTPHVLKLVSKMSLNIQSAKNLHVCVCVCVHLIYMPHERNVFLFGSWLLQCCIIRLIHRFILVSFIPVVLPHTRYDISTLILPFGNLYTPRLTTPLPLCKSVSEHLDVWLRTLVSFIFLMSMHFSSYPNSRVYCLRLLRDVRVNYCIIIFYTYL